MIIPEKLKIGGFIWTIEESEDVSREGNAYGSTHHSTQKIYIDPKATPQKKEHTVLHEIMHALWWQSGLGERYKGDKNHTEEEVIQALAHGMYQVLKDNNLII